MSILKFILLLLGSTVVLAGLFALIKARQYTKPFSLKKFDDP